MKIQFNTDKTVNGDERHEEYFSELITKKLERFESHLTRIDVHITDQNGIKEGFKDIRCLLEASIKGKQPIVVSDQSDKIEKSIAGAIEKLKASLETIIGRMNNHHKV